MKVEELMTREVVTVSGETSLKDVAALLVERHISGLPVCDADGRVLGTVSEADILAKEQGVVRGGPPLSWLTEAASYESVVKGAARTAWEAMTAPAITIEPDEPVTQATRLMLRHRVNRLPVVRDGELVGIVSRSDLVRAFARPDDEIAAEIRESVSGRLLGADDWLEVEVDDGDVRLEGVVAARSDARLLERLVARVPGVVSVECSVIWRGDDLVRSGPRR
jgi:CBS domain-containing protein